MESAPSKSTAADLARLREEIAALGPEPDAAALADFEARLERRFQAARAESDRRLAEIERDHQAALTKIEAPPAPVLRGGRAIAVLVLMVWVTGGLLLEASIGNVFFFNHGAAYSSAAPWLFLALLPPLGWGLGHLLRRAMAARYPTWARALALLLSVHRGRGRRHHRRCPAGLGGAGRLGARHAGRGGGECRLGRRALPVRVRVQPEGAPSHRRR